MIAGGILLLKNEVPFLKASLISGFSILLGLLVAFQVFDAGLLTILLISIMVDVLYQAWKWPWEVKKELNITIKDIKTIITNI
jgi:hypothetical protein